MLRKFWLSDKRSEGRLFLHFRPSLGSLLDLVTKAEVIVRGFYHADGEDLEITLLHQEHSCNLIAPAAAGSRLAGVQFGVPLDRRYIQGFGPNPGKGICILPWLNV